MANIKIAAPRLNGQSVTILHNGASRTIPTWAQAIVQALGEWSLRVPDFEYEYVTEDNGDFTFTITEPADLAVEITITKAQLEGGPVNIIPPSLSGSIAIGEEITTNAGLWASIDTPTPSYAYRYFNTAVVIGGATASTYTTVAGDAGDPITVGVIATDANGSSAEVVSAPFTPRATPWTPSDVVFDGSSYLQIDSGLFVDPDEPIEQGAGADSILIFASGLTPASTSEQFVFHISGNTYIKFNATTKALNFSSIGWDEGEANSLFGRRSDQGVPPTAPVTGERFSVLCHVRRDPNSPGEILLRMCHKFGAGAWIASDERNATGPQIEANSGILTIGARDDGLRAFTGSLTRFSAWVNIDPALFIATSVDQPNPDPDLEVPNTAIIDLFENGGLIDPTIAEAFLGQPRVTFSEGAAQFNAGTHDGSMATFTKTGTFT